LRIAARDAASFGLPALRKFALRASEASPVGMDRASEPGPASAPALLVWRTPAVFPQALSEVCWARRAGSGLSVDPRTALIPSGNPAGTMGLVSCLLYMVSRLSRSKTGFLITPKWTHQPSFVSYQPSASP